ncbi:MAG: TIGR03936 family radical SAM-associated protein [Clostridia bacterium]|nr:TIGR03936 family radical SAM-associated protein [Clostridia bacterium]
MFDYTVRYEKSGRAIYVSHLDFVRAFNRAMRRAHVPVAFSEGFNPHPKLSFAMALPIFYQSACELLEVEMTYAVSPDEVLCALNAVLPEGIRILSVQSGKSRMKELRYARYEAIPENMPKNVDTFLQMSEILIDKKTKSGVRETDIRADINSVVLRDDRIEMVLSSGSAANLKPDVVIAAMNRYIDGFSSGECSYTRVAFLDSALEEI